MSKVLDVYFTPSMGCFLSDNKLRFVAGIFLFFSLSFRKVFVYTPVHS